jgi:hypothetical protein
MIHAKFNTSKLVFVSIFMLVGLTGCATRSTVGEEPSGQLSQDDLEQCEDGSSPMCVTRMGHPARCTCKKEDMRRVLETRGSDDAIFTPTEIPGH